MSTIIFPNGMLYAEPNPALSQFVVDLRRKKKFEVVGGVVKLRDETNEEGIPFSDRFVFSRILMVEKEC